MAALHVMVSLSILSLAMLLKSAEGSLHIPPFSQALILSLSMLQYSAKASLHIPPFSKSRREVLSRAFEHPRIM